MHTNNTIENPTRNASARHMLLVLAFPFVPSFIMKKSAVAKLPSMAKNASATRYVINEIINL